MSLQVTATQLRRPVLGLRSTRRSIHRVGSWVRERPGNRNQIVVIFNTFGWSRKEMVELTAKTFPQAKCLGFEPDGTDFAATVLLFGNLKPISTKVVFDDERYPGCFLVVENSDGVRTRLMLTTEDFVPADPTTVLQGIPEAVQAVQLQPLRKSERLPDDMPPTRSFFNLRGLVGAPQKTTYLPRSEWQFGLEKPQRVMFPTADRTVLPKDLA